MTYEEFCEWLVELANENRVRAVERATCSLPNAFALSCYYDGYADALLFVARMMDRLEDRD